MSKQSVSNERWKEFHGPNLGYMLDLYEQFEQDPQSVDPSIREWFEQAGTPNNDVTSATNKGGGFDASSLKKAASAVYLAEDIRTYGHLQADIYPFDMNLERNTPYSQLDKYGLTEADLKAIPAEIVWEKAPSTVRNAFEAIEKMKEIFTGSIAFEFSHVYDKNEREWLYGMVETGEVYQTWNDKERTEVFKRLIEVEGFERFLHKTFVGQKRFSIEGLDMLVPMLDELIQQGCEDGIEDIFIGMAHRGRLNVLAHVLGKPYELILAEFHKAPNKDLVPSEGSKGINYGWTGDVKYHLGANRNVSGEQEKSVHVKLAPNPSHLEFVNPVVEGYTRAAQENREDSGRPTQDSNRAFSILIHGDAAFPGEGVVTETLNMSRLSGYETGGSIHIIANNLVGFTTDRFDSRSTKYASDVAKGYEIPIIRVNADDAENCISAINLAFAYRKKFKKDILIDLVGYRRFGHNEMDDPMGTQPLMYKKINNHPTVTDIYGKKLVSQGVMDENEIKNQQVAFESKLSEIFEEVKKNKKTDEVVEKELPRPVAEGIPEIDTSVPMETLKEINAELLNWPKDINVYPKLAKILKRRGSALDEGKAVDWGLAETLAFASILANGTPIRLTGQDSERGTFAHRHVVLHDVETNETFSPMHTLPQAKASFTVHNSPLTETAVLGFEYGYSVETKKTLVLWEAQYGDFVNVAQVIIDQFISAGRAKWGQISSLVMMLPHGYEGQGPEHSSGRLERFLTLAAENNWTVANLTSAAQYFHILRRQAAITSKDEARPLILMAPKSLIRNSRVASTGEELSEGRFNLVVNEPQTGKVADKVTRLALCSGKVAIDLTTELEKLDDKDLEWLHIARVEQLYPFPEKQLKEITNKYPNLEEIVWVQEEPKNMGSWHYMYPRIHELAEDKMKVKYIGRPDRSSPATGEPDVHKKEQQRIIDAVLTRA